MTYITLTSKGQITIPKALRDSLHLQTGDKILAERQGKSIVLKSPESNLDELMNCVTYNGPAATIEDINDAIADAAADTVKYD